MLTDKWKLPSGYVLCSKGLWVVLHMFFIFQAKNQKTNPQKTQPNPQTQPKQLFEVIFKLADLKK